MLTTYILPPLLTCWVWLALGAVVARTHDFPETQQVVLSATRDGIEVLILYEVSAGNTARMLREMIDLNLNGEVEAGLETLAQAAALMPRLSEGLAVSVDGQALNLTTENASFRDGGGTNLDRGFLGMAILVAAWPEGGRERARRIELSTSTEAAKLMVELQWSADLGLVESAVPPAADASVIGPLEVRLGLPATVVLQCVSR